MDKMFDFELMKFNSTQVAEATGVSAELQRNWRRYGFLKQEAGHARYDIFEIAEMWVLGAVGRFGIGPKLAKAYASDAAKYIAWWALKNDAGHEGDDSDRWKVPFSQYVKPNKSIGIGKKPTIGTEWAFRGKWIADQIVHGCEADGLDFPLYLVFENGSAFPADEARVPYFDPDRGVGGFICLPLSDAAMRLISSLKAPLVKVSWHGDPVEVPKE
ncbi:hypothetical protein LQT97_23245 [Brucella pseudogrignonensis]|uniref:hypothetical protein n=1 Tax=Brucella pseudogrignonensis TaxID=419475 RepID=UPI001E571B54|nr:hypothetical protein [Brucella pseudogrignonensis]MCD4514153.1 hypothetical protein [Brucella pseudogrignonensis]